MALEQLGRVESILEKHDRAWLAICHTNRALILRDAGAIPDACRSLETAVEVARSAGAVDVARRAEDLLRGLGNIGGGC